MFSSRKRGPQEPSWHGLKPLVRAHVRYIHADPILESNSVIAHRDMHVDPALLDRWLVTL
jgi:hypothetical protein